MLEITILKTTHSGENEARKLIPYILQADVYSPEMAGLTEERAKELEADWEEVLSSGASRTKFQKMIEAVSRQRLSHLDPGEREYAKAESTYLYRNKIFKWYLERWNINDGIDLDTIVKEMETAFYSSFESLKQGSVDLYLEEFWKFLQIKLGMVEKRDREIARNINLGEELIRDRYPRLATKERIRLVTAIGGVHRPEDYIAIPVTVVDLTLKEREISTELSTDLAERKSFDQLKPTIIKYGAAALAGEELISLTEADIEQMPYSDLVTLLSALKSKTP